MKMKTAYAYIRYSSEPQGKGDSVHRQTSLVNQWLSQNPEYTLSPVTYQDEGKSAYSGKHALGELGRLMSDIEQGIIQPHDVILIESFDRLSREALQVSMERLKAILIHHVDVVTLNNGKLYTFDSLNDPMSIIEHVLLAKLANDESRNKGERVHKAWKAKREEAQKTGKVMSRMAPRWLTVKEDKTGFDIIPERVSVLQLIFQLRLEGKSLGSIASHLNENCVPTFKNHSKGWNQSVIGQLLSSRAVIGHHVKKSKRTGYEDEIQDYYPCVIPIDIFQAAQLSKEPRFGKKPENRKYYRVNIFRGVLKCKSCHGAIVINSCTERNHGYYQCSFKRLKRCDVKPCKRSTVDEAITKGLLYNLDRLTINPQGVNPLHELEAQREDLIGRSQKLLEALEVSNDVTVLAKRLEAVEAEIATLNRQITSLSGTFQAKAAESLQGILDVDTVEAKVEIQRVVRKHFKAIYLDTEKMTIDAYMNNGLKLLNVPVDRVVDTGEWIELAQVIESDVIDFDRLNVRNPPRYLQESE